MLNWHWVCRDFIDAASKADHPKGWLQAMQSDSFDLQRDWLEPLHFKPKGYTSEQAVLDRLQALAP